MLHNLGTPNVKDEGDQQPSSLKLMLIVGEKVQRLTGKDSASNNPDTSARHPNNFRMMI
jgi:hypothetical protein